MSFKSLFICVLVGAIVAAPIAEAQLGLIGRLLGLIRIQGQIFCTVNGNIGVDGLATPVFPNAMVRLQCQGNVVSTITTNASGIFSFVIDPLQLLLSTLLRDCNLVVATPLSTCNVNLPSVGGPSSRLQFIKNTIQGPLVTANVGPVGFSFPAKV